MSDKKRPDFIDFEVVDRDALGTTDAILDDPEVQEAIEHLSDLIDERLKGVNVPEEEVPQRVKDYFKARVRQSTIRGAKKGLDEALRKRLEDDK